MRDVQGQEPAAWESYQPELSSRRGGISARGARARAFVSSMRAAWLRAAAVMAVCCCVLGAGATQAGAAPTWLVPHDLSEAEQEATAPQVAVASDGEAIVTWEAEGEEGHSIIWAKTRPAGGEWSSKPQQLSNPKEDAEAPQVAIDPEGDAVVVWQQRSEEAIEAATRPAGGQWSKPKVISVAGLRIKAAAVAIDSHGEATATWEAEGEEGHSIVQAATHPAGGEWSSEPQTLSKPPEGPEYEAGSPQVAVNPEGDAVAVWQLYKAFPSEETAVRAATRPAGGEWSKPQTLSEESEHEAGEVQVAVGPEGDAIAVWHTQGSSEVIHAKTRPAGGKWSTLQTLSDSEQKAGSPEVAIGPEGDAVAVWWYEENGSNTVIQAKTRPVGGEWSNEPQTLSEEPEHGAYAPQVAVGPEGDAVAVWLLVERESGEEHETIQAATWLTSGQWSKPQSLSEAESKASYPGVAVDSQGDAVAVWPHHNHSHWIIRARGYDAAGPQLRSLAIPTAGKTGQSLSFSVSPLDVWSALGQTSWSFGDGTSATGTSVTHAYAKAGSYQVTLTGQDALGNTSTATGTVTITAPAPEPKPTPSPEEPPTPQPKPVNHCKAFAAHLVHVKGKIALVRLRFRGKGRCHGVVKLIDRIKVKRVVKRHGRRKTIRRNKRVVIGKASFTVAAGNTTTIKVKLTAKGRTQLRKARHHRLKAHIAGHDVKHRAVILTASHGNHKRASGSRRRRS